VSVPKPASEGLAGPHCGDAARAQRDRQLKQARWRLDDCYGMAMSDEHVKQELVHLDRWKRRLHVLSTPSYEQIEAMLHYCRLARIPLPKSLRGAEFRRQVATRSYVHSRHSA
jgi:hypothetical protein